MTGTPSAGGRTSWPPPPRSGSPKESSIPRGSRARSSARGLPPGRSEAWLCTAARRWSRRHAVLVIPKTGESRIILHPSREDRARDEMKVARMPKCSDDQRGGHAAQHGVGGRCRTSHRALLTRARLRVRQAE